MPWADLPTDGPCPRRASWRHHRQPSTRPAGGVLRDPPRGAAPRRRPAARHRPRQGDAGRLRGPTTTPPGSRPPDKNVLAVINRALHADFDLDAFDHVARWDAEAEWIEMLLRSLRRPVGDGRGPGPRGAARRRRGHPHRDQCEVPAGLASRPSFRRRPFRPDVGDRRRVATSALSSAWVVDVQRPAARSGRPRRPRGGRSPGPC